MTEKQMLEEIAELRRQLGIGIGTEREARKQLLLAERERDEARKLLQRLKDRIDNRLDAYLCEMKEGYDDSITGFNEAWDIVRNAFAEVLNDKDRHD
jgi:hypothetical protein